VSGYRFGWAETGNDYAALRRLNHDVFASELGQHSETPEGALVDRFEVKSRFLLAWRGENLVGMIALHDQPPFSVEKRLREPEVLAQYEGRKLEVRLLAIQSGERSRMVLAGLLGRVLQLALDEGYRWLLISGLRERMKFYARLGFVAIGPPVESGRAFYAPMVMDVGRVPEEIAADFERWRRREGG